MKKVSVTDKYTYDEDDLYQMVLRENGEINWIWVIKAMDSIYESLNL